VGVDAPALSASVDGGTPPEIAAQASVAPPASEASPEPERSTIDAEPK
jgi:hypothetical protein